MTSSCHLICSWKAPDCEFILLDSLFPFGQLTVCSDYADQVWVWENEEGATFYFDVGEIVRLRVEMEEWHDQIPNAPDQQDATTVSERKPPYSIVVCTSMCQTLSLLACTDISFCTGFHADGRSGAYLLVVMPSHC